jgi:RNA polymerase sigma factor (sigma-70 family)
MADAQPKNVICYLRELAAPAGGANAGDVQFLDRFVRQRDQAAYEAILRRHGPMVLGTCLRVLNNFHDAEDAFQATFLVLARKARSIGRGESLGGWLYRIAYRVALRAKTQAARRYARQSPLEDMPAGDSVPELAWAELRPVLDEELNRLPGRYRDAVVLCYFEGKTYAEVAQALGLAEGTVSSRLARARDLLRKRLVRRGLTLSSGLVATVFSQKALAAALPLAWVNSTAQAALRFTASKAGAGAASEPVNLLTEGVLQAMLLSKVRLVAVVLLTVTLLSSSAAVLAHQMLTGKANTPKERPPGVAPPIGKPPPEQKAPAVKSFENEFGYTWSIAPQEFTCPPPGSYSLWGKDGVACTFAQGKQGELIITLAQVGPQGKEFGRCRPVVFDAGRKRHAESCQPVGGGSSNGGASLEIALFTFGPTPVPGEKVKYLGIEVLTPEGVKAIVARAIERAKATGIEVLPPAFVGQTYDFSLTTLAGKKVRAVDLRGKVVLIDCWSTSCSPCMAKMPQLKSLYEKYHPDGFEIIGVSLDVDAGRVREACRSKGLTWPQVLVPPDAKTREIWYEAAGLESVPRLLLIDREGVLRADCGPDQLAEEVTKVMNRR